MAKDEKKRPIVIRRIEVVEGGHHGGAWKVAYADFVTAMMAFFLLMWLLNATSAEQKQGLADYFTPSNLMSHNNSGFGQPFGGHTPNDQGELSSDRGAVQVMNSNVPPTDAEDDDSDVPAHTVTYRDNGHAADPSDKLEQHAGPAAETKAAADAARQDNARQEKAAFQQAAQQIQDQVAQDPALASLAKQIAVDVTPEGLRIQILDGDKQAMFASGSAVLNDRARALLLKVAPVLLKLHQKLSITGHTDAAPYKGGDRSNWELSADRANATRRLFAEAGLPEARVQTVSGRADRDPLLPADPSAPANRRIAIVVLRDAVAAKPRG